MREYWKRSTRNWLLSIRNTSVSEADANSILLEASLNGVCLPLVERVVMAAVVPCGIVFWLRSGLKRGSCYWYYVVDRVCGIWIKSKKWNGNSCFRIGYYLVRECTAAGIMWNDKLSFGIGKHWTLDDNR